MTYINLLVLTCIICFIIDVSGIMTDIRKRVAKTIENRTKMKVDYNELKLKPIGCSLCMTWWIGIAYLLICKEFTIANLGYVTLLSLISSNISEFELLIKDYISYFQCWLQKLLQK